MIPMEQKCFQPNRGDCAVSVGKGNKRFSGPIHYHGSRFSNVIDGMGVKSAEAVFLKKFLRNLKCVCNPRFVLKGLHLSYEKPFAP